MQALLKNFLPICLLLSISALTDAKSSVWKITSGDNILFLGGTIHLLTKQDFPLPAEFELAYQRADLLVFEVEPDIVNSPASQQKFAQYAYYSDGTQLSDVLDTSTYQMLNNFLTSRGLLMTSFESMKPGMLAAVLTVVELQRLGLAGKGVDEFFSDKSRRDNKSQLALETIDDQFRALATLGIGRESFTIRHALGEAEKIAGLMQDIKKAWRAGDNQALVNVSLTPWMNRFPALYESLLVQRNNRWLPQLEALLATPAKEYVLVGALHLVGKDGLLRLLRQKGYKVEQLIKP
ncbi:MAG: hypothetical protein ACI80S_001919 [Pseudohongiellaceae bacterium]|jgi:uncharacterized protein YbaP (TraB family)